MRLLTVLIIAAGTLSACSDNTAILVPDPSRMPAGAREPALVRNGAITAATGFSFAPPIAQRPPAHNGPFDGALAPSVMVCELNSVDACQATVATFTTAGSGEERVRVDLQDELYQVNWSTRGLTSGKSYRVRVLLWAMEIGSADFRLVANGAGLHSLDARYVGAVTGSTVPIKFRIEEAVLWNGLPPVTLSRTSAAPGGALELGGVGTSAGTTVSIGNAPAIARDGGRGTLLTFAPVFLGPNRWPAPPSGPQHVIVLRDGIPIAGGRAALTITPLQKAAGSSQAALQALMGIAERFGALSDRLTREGSADAVHLQAIAGAFDALVGGSDPRSLASRLQHLASTDPGAIELLDALMASTGLTTALHQYGALMAGVSVPEAPASMMSASREAPIERSPGDAALTGFAAFNAETGPTATNITAVELAAKMQLYVVVKLFSETVVSGTNSTWANYIAAAAGFLGVLGPQVPPVAYVGAVLAIADFVANKVIVGQMPARLSTFTLEIVETQLNLDEQTISVVTAVGENDPATMGVQDVTNLFLSVVAPFTGDAMIGQIAEQSAREIANFFLGFLQNLLTVLSSQHPELNLDVTLLSGPRWAWRAVVTDPRLVDRKTQTPSIITGVADAVNWRASAVNRGDGRIFAQTALGPDAIVISLPTGFYYTGGAFGENVEITNKVDVVVGGRVTVSPDPVTVAPHGTQQFTAAVLGLSNTAVTWTTSDPGGIVSASGMYTAGPNSGVFSVTAISVEDPTSSDAAQVNVVAPPVSTGTLVLTRVDGATQVQVTPQEGARCTQSHWFPTTTTPAASTTLQTAQCQTGGGSATATNRYSSIETLGRMTMFTASGQAVTSSGTEWTYGDGSSHAFYDFEVSGGDVSVTLTGQLDVSVPDLSSNTEAKAAFILSRRAGARLVDREVGRDGNGDEMVPPTTLSGTYVLTPGNYRVNVFASGNSMALIEDVEGVPTLRVASGSSSFTFTLRVQ